MASSPPPDQQQREQITHELDRTMLVEAAAGTGKTTMLIERMVALLVAGKCTVDSLAAVTFTRKAAADIRARFQVRLEIACQQSAGARQQRLRESLDHIDRCFIGTIHSFCARLLRERPIEAGVDLGFVEIDEETDMRLRRQAWHDYVESLFESNDSVLEDLEEVGLALAGTTQRRDPLLEQLDQLGLEVIQLGPAFLDMVEFPDVTDWPANTTELPDLVPLRSKLDEYLQHLRALLPTLPEDPGRDKLMPAMRQVLRMADLLNLDRPADLMELLERFRAYDKGEVVQKNWPSKPLALSEMQLWNDFGRQHADPALERWREKRYEVVMRAIRPAVHVYDRLRRERNALNFQDLLLKAVELLRDKPQVRNYFRNRYTHLLIDEFQDTDPIQAEVMLLLTADDPRQTNWQLCRPTAGSLFVVGDPKQSIYRFRRADIVTYCQVKAIIEKNGGAVVTLASNFRSVKSHLDWVNEVFRGVFPAEATDYMPAHCELLAGRDELPEAKLAGLYYITVPTGGHNADVVEQEATLIANTIHRAIEEGWTIARRAPHEDPRAAPGDFLIITWNRKQLSAYAHALQEVGVPYQVTGSSSVNQIDELALLHRVLRAATRPDDAVALLAVLRSPLFGISDQALYAFRQVGGAFQFYSEIPASFTDSEASAILEVFERLRRYANWLRQFPVVTAVEKIIVDLGLAVRACISVVGPAQAGGLLKTLELIRAAHTSMWSTAELVDYLGQLVDETELHDSLPVRPELHAPVRIMNLHKAKGLEAPVVFLANPTGYAKHPVVMHIDRSGDQPRGYLAVYGQKRSKFGTNPLLAHPRDWQQWVEHEETFLNAEFQRLMYVAATRAGNQLVVSRRQDSKNPWQFFEPYLNSALELPDARFSKVSSTVVDVPFTEMSEIKDALQLRWQACETATYKTIAAKDQALTKKFKPHGVGEDAAEWGTVIHGLLEAATAQPDRDLHRLALTLLNDQGLSADLATQAVETVQAVARSDLWKRATASDKCLVEVPFASLVSDAAVPTVLRGVIDLAFLENGNWVIVDYKTEKIAEKDVRQLVSYYRDQVRLYAQYWESITGQRVSETGLFLTHLQRYERVPR